jgi:guanylate kinase
VTAVTVGSEETRLVVLRGNSASGKSSVAAGLRSSAAAWPWSPRTTSAASCCANTTYPVRRTSA